MTEKNTGNWNTGNWNTGDWNTGYWNTGYRNTGNWNTGDWNTGNRNTGDWNTGNWNTGNRNTGNRNTGDWNTGNWNTGDRNTGFFNTTTPELVNCFNSPTNREEFENAIKPNWLFEPRPTDWVCESKMSDAEKVENPTFHTCGGYLKMNDMKGEWRKALATATDEEVQMVRDLPNFDTGVFEEITGLDLRVKSYVGKTVEIDGVKYKLVKE